MLAGSADGGGGRCLRRGRRRLLTITLDPRTLLTLCCPCVLRLCTWQRGNGIVLAADCSIAVLAAICSIATAILARAHSQRERRVGLPLSSLQTGCETGVFLRQLWVCLNPLLDCLSTATTVQVEVHVQVAGARAGHRIQQRVVLKDANAAHNQVATNIC